jgi:hypothetical protein
MNIKTIQAISNLKDAIDDSPLYEEPEFLMRLKDLTEKMYWILQEKQWDAEDRAINAGYEEHTMAH